jgi:hypothetical protein
MYSRIAHFTRILWIRFFTLPLTLPHDASSKRLAGGCEEKEERLFMTVKSSFSIQFVFFSIHFLLPLHMCAHISHIFLSSSTSSIVCSFSPAHERLSFMFCAPLCCAFQFRRFLFVYLFGGFFSAFFLAAQARN